MTAFGDSAKAAETEAREAELLTFDKEFCVR